MHVLFDNHNAWFCQSEWSMVEVASSASRHGYLRLEGSGLSDHSEPINDQIGRKHGGHFWGRCAWRIPPISTAISVLTSS